MSDSAISLFVFGIYLLFLGAGYSFIPNLILTKLKFPKTDEPWIRIMGILIIVIGYYYIVAAQNEFINFFSATVIGRFGEFVAFVLLVLAKKAPPILIAFGLIDAIGGLWTFLTL